MNSTFVPNTKETNRDFTSTIQSKNLRFRNTHHAGFNTEPRGKIVINDNDTITTNGFGIKSPQPDIAKTEKLVTQEDKERYENVILEAKNRIIFPENPCLFTAKVKIASQNKKIE